MTCEGKRYLLHSISESTNCNCPWRSRYPYIRHCRAQSVFEIHGVDSESADTVMWINEVGKLVGFVVIRQSRDVENG